MTQPHSTIRPLLRQHADSWDRELDRGVIAADLQPVPVLRLLLRSTAEGNHRLARRCRLHLRRVGYAITAGRLDPASGDEAVGHFEQLIAALRAKDFRRATAASERLRRSYGVGVMLVPARERREL